MVIYRRLRVPHGGSTLEATCYRPDGTGTVEAVPSPAAARATDGLGPASAPLSRGRRSSWFPILVLMTLSITFAEFMTGSTPFFTAFLNPISLLFLFGLYGLGVLLVREASVRFRNGWVSVVFLGMAYGILEEGFGTKTFFDPNSSVVGFFGTYGHFAGVNWVWAFQLTIFHAVFSIALPILFLGLLFPATQGQRLISPNQTVLALVGFVFTVAVMFVLFDRASTPSAGLLAASAAVVVAFAVLARRAQPDWFAVLSRWGPRTPKQLLAAGAGFVSGFFFLNWVGSHYLAVPATVVLLELALGTLVVALVLPTVNFGGSPRARLAFGAGLLSFMFVLATLQGFTGDWGVVFPIAGVLYMLWYLNRSIPSSEPPAVPAHVLGTAPGS